MRSPTAWEPRALVEGGDGRAKGVVRILRLAWSIASLFVVESLVFGVSLLPAVLFWQWHLTWQLEPPWFRVFVLSMAAIPAYLVFAVAFMMLSALAMRIAGWRPPRRAEVRIDAFEWPMLDWIRYTISFHMVRVFSGSFLRTTPLWVLYMRLNGARLGRRVWVNSLDVTDHCMLEFGDDVVIGGGVHLSGHTVERGLFKTAPVVLGRGVTIGVGANIEIGVEAGPECQIGALSAVPKFQRLEGHSTYVGIPARKIETRADAASAESRRPEPPRETGR